MDTGKLGRQLPRIPSIRDWTTPGCIAPQFAVCFRDRIVVIRCEADKGVGPKKAAKPWSNELLERAILGFVDYQAGKCRHSVLGIRARASRLSSSESFEAALSFDRLSCVEISSRHNTGEGPRQRRTNRRGHFGPCAPLSLQEVLAPKRCFRYIFQLIM